MYTWEITTVCAINPSDTSKSLLLPSILVCVCACVCEDYGSVLYSRSLGLTCLV